MGTTTDKLNRLVSTKTAIQQAIVMMGVNVSGEDTFASYADKIKEIPQGGSGGVDEFLATNGLTYLAPAIINAVSRAITINTTGTNFQEIANSIPAKALFVNNTKMLTSSANANGSIISVRNLDLSETVNGNNLFRNCVNLYEVTGIGENGMLMFSEAVNNLGDLFSGSSVHHISVSAPNATNATSLCNSCPNLTKAVVKLGRYVPCMFGYFFSNCPMLTEIDLGDGLKIIGGTISTACRNMFANNVQLTKITGIVDVSNCTEGGFSGVFDNTLSLEEVWIYGLSADGLTIKSPLLKKECVLYIFNNAVRQTTTKRLYLHTNVINALTPEEIQIMTDKGFTITA